MSLKKRVEWKDQLQVLPLIVVDFRVGMVGMVGTEEMESRGLMGRPDPRERKGLHSCGVGGLLAHGPQSLINLDNQLDKIFQTLVERLAGANIGRSGVNTGDGTVRTEKDTNSISHGIMAGSYYKHTGTGANQLCLPLDPQFNKTYPAHQSKSYLYGTEFQIRFGNDVFRTTNSGGVLPHDREAQCAVCYTPGRLSHLMIPARLECPSGWTVEYLGFLMSQHHTYHKSEYVCVDQDPDTHPATAANLDGNLLYVVEAACGSLPCPPYVDGYEITCVGPQSLINLDNQLDKIFQTLVERLAGANIGSSGVNTGDGTVRTEKDTNSISHGGVVYTRWGRNICPDHSQRLYSGIMAGSYYKHTGSGANQLCLPLDPQFNKTYPGYQSKSYLYGTEFQINYDNDVFYTTNSGGVVPHNREAQCAVCYTPGRLSHLMIPVRLECPLGWTVEYLGFLMSQYNKFQKSEYVCVDQDPDTHPATAANLDGNLLYVVEAACGSLPCPPYVDGYEITCVVCTK
ncbi:uncharacterized protein LOC135469887 [Liolophura sinensis]|uniref:uncharacterized protein LOC135469887 n=1 Tax=Liolophura sinensis TaxID=3198878 RepID=UPI0031580F04